MNHTEGKWRFSTLKDLKNLEVYEENALGAIHTDNKVIFIIKEGYKPNSIFPNEAEAKANAMLAKESKNLLKCAEMLLDLCETWDKQKAHTVTKPFEELNKHLTKNNALIEFAKITIKNATR